MPSPSKSCKTTAKNVILYNSSNAGSSEKEKLKEEVKNEGDEI